MTEATRKIADSNSHENSHDTGSPHRTPEPHKDCKGVSFRRPSAKIKNLVVVFLGEILERAVFPLSKSLWWVFSERIDYSRCLVRNFYPLFHQVREPESTPNVHRGYAAFCAPFGHFRNRRSRRTHFDMTPGPRSKCRGLGFRVRPRRRPSRGGPGPGPGAPGREPAGRRRRSDWYSSETVL